MARLARNLLVATSAVLLIAAGPGAIRSWAHAGDRVQLHLARIEAHGEGSSQWTLHVALVDADSGRPAPGFRVSVAGGADGGRSFGPQELADTKNSGVYRGTVRASAGSWSVQVQAREVPGGEPAVPLDTTSTVDFVPGHADPQAGEPETGQPTPGAAPIQAHLERWNEAGPNPNWVSLRTLVTDVTSGRGISEGLEVFVTAKDPSGQEAEAVPLGPSREDGVFSGFSIVPHGGSWTFTAVVNQKRADGEKRPPVTYGKASLVADVSAPDLEGSTATGVNSRGVRGNAGEALILWLHSVLAVAWIGLVGILAMGAQPAVRRLLSERGTSILDSRIDSVIRGVWWLTAGVVATGVYNIVKSTPYLVPLTATRFHEVASLPYGRPYYAVLLAKVLIYIAMVAAAVPVVARSRRAATAWVPRAMSGPSAEPASSPWDGPGGSATRTVAPRTATAVMSADPPRRYGYRLEALLVAGAVLLTLAVTLLKYLHLLSETVLR